MQAADTPILNIGVGHVSPVLLNLEQLPVGSDLELERELAVHDGLHLAQQFLALGRESVDVALVSVLLLVPASHILQWGSGGHMTCK